MASAIAWPAGVPSHGPRTRVIPPPLAAPMVLRVLFGVKVEPRTGLSTCGPMWRRWHNLRPLVTFGRVLVF